MTHIIRDICEKGDHRLLMQGRVVDEDYVEPSTVRVFALWTNYSGEDQVGPELVTKNKAGMKLANRVAVHLTKQFRKSNDGTPNE